MDSIIDIAKGTPIWVYILFFYLMHIGIKASKPATFPIQKLFFAPVVFTLMSLETLYTHFTMTLHLYGLFGITSLIGGGIGWYEISKQSFKFDREHLLISLPGTWLTMVYILIIFNAKFYFGYQMDVDPHALDNTLFEQSYLALSAICSGIFVGRVACYLFRMSTEQSTDLSSKDP